jgi:hypothetical protein
MQHFLCIIERERSEFKGMSSHTVALKAIHFLLFNNYNEGLSSIELFSRFYYFNVYFTYNSPPINYSG